MHPTIVGATYTAYARRRCRLPRRIAPIRVYACMTAILSANEATSRFLPKNRIRLHTYLFIYLFGRGASCADLQIYIPTNCLGDATEDRVRNSVAVAVSVNEQSPNSLSQ